MRACERTTVLSDLHTLESSLNILCFLIRFFPLILSKA